MRYFLVAGTVLFSCALFGQDLTKMSVVRAKGEATVSVKPDQVTIDVGVVTEGETASAAGVANAKQAAQVLEELKKIAGSAADVRTLNYSVSPNYRNPKPGGVATIAGYTASNIVRMKSDDLSTVGKALDTLTRAGANRINNIQFGLKDESAVKLDALRQATVNARKNADGMAGALAAKVVRIVSLEEGGSEPIVPMQKMAMMSMAREAQDTGIEPGQIEVRAFVTLTAEIK
jgi:uncharacterized protein YggE